MKKDIEKVSDKLLEVGGALIYSTLLHENETWVSPMTVDFWQVNQKGLIVCGYDDGSCGLYAFVGKSGESVEADLRFIEDLV